MQLLRKNILLIFWVVALGEIATQFIDAPLPHLILKPLLLPLLIIAVLLQTWPSKPRQLILSGAVFSFAGDVLLLLQDKNPNFFIFGLVCFLITHICYSLYFLQVKKSGISLLKQKPYLLFLTLLYSACLLYLLVPKLGDLRIPVIVYAIVITIMVLCSLRAYNFSAETARLSFVMGAVFFVISDSLLAINKFYSSFAGAGFFIMLTYCLAQYFILTGFIKNNA
ncbi:MAG: lysoplasmalogenase [Bacteroidetes bacterium]|nr:lysoplasmalogenase [Bacteroidota bacterium]